jgi:hypothetical protein
LSASSLLLGQSQQGVDATSDAVQGAKSARFPSLERVLETLLKGFARMLPLVNTTRGGLYGVEITGECVAN